MVTYKNILICTDFSEHSAAAVPHAVDLAKRHNAALHILHVYQEPGHIAEFEISSDASIDWLNIAHLVGAQMQERLKALWEQTAKEVDTCVCKMLRGKPHEEIVRYALEADIDVIVMGSHGLTGFEHILFGATAEHVLRESPRSVFVVKKSG